VAKSFSPLRYVGGKSRLVPILLEYLPETPKNYFEPFCGSGALFFAYGFKATERTYLNDINYALMNAFGVMSQNINSLLAALTNLGDTSYLNLRTQYNTLKVRIETEKLWSDEDREVLAALFIALNHLCFNGVYRENKKGEFNVPVGKNAEGIERTLGSLDTNALVEAGNKLKGANIRWGSFTPWPFDKTPGPSDVAVFDPPYLKEFSGYDKSGFAADQHILLAAQAGAIAKKGATVIVCGSNNAASHEIYGKPTRVVTLARTVGNFSESDKKRGPAEEALWIYNPRSPSATQECETLVPVTK
jgi:DNA adenine methylase